VSPRAAWRLETLGFSDVYDYTDGKLDWMAAGLPTEGTSAARPRAADVARTDVLTCRLDEQLGDVSRRAAAAGSEAAVVVNEERVVLGLLRRKELAGDPGQPVEHAMRLGPSTYRPDAAVDEVATFMTDHNLDSTPITTSDGRLVGLLMKEDAARVARELQVGHETADMTKSTE
jgi:CBS domain-containing protein